MQNSILGAAAVFILFVFHVIIRKLRRIEEAIACELNPPKRLEIRRALQELLDEASRPVEEEGPIEAGQTQGMTPAEVLDHYAVKLEADGDGIKIAASEKKENIVIPDLPFRGDWRDTPGYRKERASGNCVSCGKETNGKCDNDTVCFTCYESGAYAGWLLSVNRGLKEFSNDK